MTINVELLNQAVDWAKIESKKPEEKSQWYQGDWVSTDDDSVFLPGEEIKCGTSFCIAGWISVTNLKRGEYMDFCGDIYKKKNNSYVTSAAERAAELLGIDEEQADDLFDGYNTLPEVKKIVKKIIKDAS